MAPQIDAAWRAPTRGSAGVLLDELRHAEQKVGATEATRLHTPGRKSCRRRADSWSRCAATTTVFSREQAADAASADQDGPARRRVAKALAAYERAPPRPQAGAAGEGVRRPFQPPGAQEGPGRRRAHRSCDVRHEARRRRRARGAEGRGCQPARSRSYAISMLWALARTSGRPLPMIIDTPLGRLDSEHRANLVQRYFPAASHQVILLSTDTEVDGRLLAELGDQRVAQLPARLRRGMQGRTTATGRATSDRIGGGGGRTSLHYSKLRISLDATLEAEGAAPAHRPHAQPALPHRARELARAGPARRRIGAGRGRHPNSTLHG